MAEVTETSTVANIDPTRFGKVAVVMGGWSAERDVSLMSGEQVLDALNRAGVDAHAVDAGSDIGVVLTRGGFARAFLILHGRGGEDGTVQAALDLAGVPYTGSGVLGSALAMDKWRAKALVGLAGVPTAVARRAGTRAAARGAASAIGYPLVVKPTHEGSSIGISMVASDAELDAAWEEASRYGDVMLEARLPGVEVTVAVLGEHALPAVSMRASGEFYDYHAKYIADDTEYRCPAEIDDECRKRVERYALDAFAALDCRGWGRIDFILDSSGEPQFVECNTAPGMTSHSLVPIAARAIGMDFTSLCLAILSDTLGSDGRMSPETDADATSTPDASLMRGVGS